MKRILLAALLGGLVHFVWGAFSWMVLPWHDPMLKDLPGESTILPVLRQNVGEAGIYWFPGPQDAKLSEASAEAFEKKHNEGPIGWLVYHPQGRPTMPKSTFVKGFLIDFLSALLAASLVAASAPRGYVGRVFLVIALGLFAALVSHAMQWNWMFMPAGYTSVMMADLVLGWSLAGLVIAALVRRKA
jgi:hypothetical protein